MRSKNLLSITMTEKFLHDTAGERPEQLLITCDKKGNVTGTNTRESCHKGEGLTHLAFMSFLLDNSGRVVLTKRNPAKSLWGNFWDASVVSHILQGETVGIAAKRRAGEELGIETEFKVIGSFFYQENYGDSSENEFCYILIGKTQNPINPNEKEIAETKFLNQFELEKFFTDNTESLTPWFIKAGEYLNLEKALWSKS